MYDNITYDQLKELPVEQKKEALIALKGKYPTYKEMAQAIGGNPVALANLYLRLVEGQKFGGRKKKEVVEQTAPEAPVVPEIPIAPVALETPTQKEKPKRGRRKATDKAPKATETKAITTVDEKKEIAVVAPKKVVSFTISLETEGTGDEAKSRIEGVAGSLMKDKTYKVKLTIEEM